MPLFTPELCKRIASAAVLAPLVLWVVWMGGWPFWGLVLAAFAFSVYEGLSLAMRTRWSMLVAPVVVVYLAVAMTAFVLLRDKGPIPVMALLLAVWMTDVGAYAAGRLIGGPKMAPTISPNKTWAGLIGGIMGSMAAFYAVSLFTPGHENAVTLVAFGAVIAVVGQLGDLMESLLKRQAQAKDSGSVIPGHGGVLDRIDSLLLAAPVFLLALNGVSG